MAKDIWVSEDHHAKEIRNALDHMLSSDPGSPVEGQNWYDTTNHYKKYRDNSTTQIIAARSWVTSLTISSLTAPTGDFAMNSHKITGLLDPGAAQDAATQNYVLTRSLSAFAAPTTDLSIGTHKLTSVVDPSNPQDAATKAYVDAAIQTNATGLNGKQSVKAASVGSNITLPPGGTTFTLDGISMANGDRVLLKDQTTGSANGIYTVSGIGTSVVLTRATDADTAAEIQSAYVFVDQGTVNQSTAWYMTTDAVVLGTTSLTWIKFFAGSTGARGVSVTGPSSGVTSWVVTHNLGTTNLVVTVVQASNSKVADIGITYTDANNMTFDLDGGTFTTNQFTANIVAIG